MRALIAAVALGGALAPSVTVAEELDLGFFGSAEYDNNAFNSTDGATDDVVVRAGPIIGLRRPQGAWTYDLRYEPRFETFVDESGLDEWDHAAFGRVRWQFAPTTAVTVLERFNLTHSLNRSTFIGDPVLPDATPEPEIEVARQELIQNWASIELSHSFTERLYGTLTGNQGLFRTDREDRFDSDTYAGTGELLYTLTSRNRLGGGASVSFQDFDDIETADGRVQQGQDTTFFRVFGSWLYLFDPTFEITLRAGPTWIDADRSANVPEQAIVQTYPFRTTDGGTIEPIDASTCPTDDGVPYLAERCGTLGALPPEFQSFFGASRSAVSLEDEEDGGAEDIALFAQLELLKRWERFRARFSYTRSDSTSSGVGQSTILDVVTLQFIWDPTPVWSLSLIGSWSLRQSSTDQLGTAVGLASDVAEVPVLLPTGDLVVVPVPAARAVSLRLVESDDFVDVMTYQATLRVRRRIGRRTEVFGQLTYLRQDQDGTTARDEFDNFRALIGARWMFDPINVL